MAFALASAVEKRVAVRDARWVNLSEQFLCQRITAAWDPANPKDGANTRDVAKRFGDGYRPRIEDLWNYDRCPFRRAGDEAESLLDLGGSCVGYDKTWSDTVHQGAYLCSTVGGATYGDSHPTGGGGGEVRARRMPPVPR